MKSEALPAIAVRLASDYEYAGSVDLPWLEDDYFDIRLRPHEEGQWQVQALRDSFEDLGLRR